jgi:anti-sigma B factor antagonist
MKIEQRQVGDVSILDLSGNLVIGSADELRDVIRALVAAGKNRLLLNLGGLGYIDSYGIGELISASSAITKEGGQMKLSNPPKKVWEILTLSSVITVLDVSDTESEALMSFD